jgi:hypothetical protein
MKGMRIKNHRYIFRKDNYSQGQVERQSSYKNNSPRFFQAINNPNPEPSEKTKPDLKLVPTAPASSAKKEPSKKKNK